MTNPKKGQLKLFDADPVIGNYLHSLKENEKAMEDRRSIHKIASTNAIKMLSEFSITTLEEAIGAARANQKAMAGVVGADVARELASNPVLERISLGNLLLSEVPRFEAQKYVFGARLGAPDKNPDFETAALPPTGSTSATVNLITSPCMPPIGDQGQRWTCVAFATCAVVEFARCRARGNAARRDGIEDLSEQFQYWNCKDYESSSGGSYTSLGTYPEISYPLTVRDGICREAVWPYDMVNDPSQHDPHVPAAQRDAAAQRVRRAIQIGSHRDVATLKKYLSAGDLVGVAIPVYDSWELSPVVRATGNITLPLPGETSEAGHALVLVGYEDNVEFAGGGFFIIRNSWGLQWAPLCPFGAGYGTLPYRYIETENMSAFAVEA